MSKFSSIAAAALISLTISACSDNDGPDSGEVTETQMDDVDVIDGTISDDMVDVDTIQKADATGEEEESDKAGDEKTAGDQKEAESGDEKETPETPAE